MDNFGFLKMFTRIVDKNKQSGVILERTTENLTRTQEVQDCQTIDELEKLFDKFGIVKGTTKEYDAEKLKYKVEQIKFMINSGLDFDKISWNVITRTHGIRAKCMELFYYEKNEKPKECDHEWACAEDNKNDVFCRKCYKSA